MMDRRKVRVGIDVGGTFTDAAVIDNETYEVIAKMKIPTTHHDEDGVAKGIVQILNQILESQGILPDDVTFIAHGTTQATNALLEGDVARVGIIGMGSGLDGISARSESNPGNIELAPGKYLKTYHTYLDSKNLKEEDIATAIDELAKQGAEVIVASEAYSVDDPTNELRVVEIAHKKGIYATGGHEISQLYGLKTRTRTAVVNASLIPKMMETANMTEKSVKNANIKSPLMIMRCDGGVMSIDEVRKRPILTMLSGLAAGVAGALMYEKISDGIFFEVGGTSVDISVIKNGKVMIKNAQVGGHRTYLQSLDVRTLGIAGGSMVKVANGRITDIGPRSAHIAGIEYEAFAPSDQIMDPKVKFISPRNGDPQEYVICECANGKDYSYTLAGAANILGYIPEGDYAEGNKEAAITAWEALASHVGLNVEEAARAVMNIAIDKTMKTVNDMIEDYELDRSFVTLVGGGGSGAVLVPAMAERENMKFRIANNAPYVSTIGVALAMVKEQLERTVVNPTEGDIKRIRSEVLERIVKSGASEDTVEVTIEIDSQKNILRAIATGSTELRSKDLGQEAMSIEDMRATAAQSVDQPVESTVLAAQTGRWSVFSNESVKKSFFGLMKKRTTYASVLDREGVVRFKKGNVQFTKITKSQFGGYLGEFLDENTIYSDANATIPKAFVFYKEKMLDLTGMQTKEQLMSILEIETEMLTAEDELIVIAYQ
ncbi:hydantoinase/oxoprolinase family protein [Paenibacillus macquariensis]|uniref:N-methylhydantoinase A/oxoprolinase/acetone carboxylase, beta subunit n=1 Tax=Paenibacillus macquariensis TaxID=948756 RepID=A0ABY1KD15_9BACL|nr:hydantoinase/oxoprolinase family protein [Paenibacillus macquariensis]MEC0093201.1 hydantoinase/oxoprolinase family protein [Paenibacillus macquariensis]SIR62720.1 N-methylhydantoinase A/oxoprolinase/acetone carboxylase, beta subunit [Paenibacillus macquariensis]